jgi:hypothetical protein
MAKVIEFTSRTLAKKGMPIPERVTPGMLIEFPKPKPVNHSENAVNRKTAQAITPGPFFGCF